MVAWDSNPYSAFILVSTKPQKEHDVYDKMKAIPYTEYVHPLFGEYDMIMKVDSKGLYEVKDIVTNGIRSVSDVIDVKTLHTAIISQPEEHL